MKAIPFVFVFAAVILLSCVGQQPSGPGAITTGTVYFSITDDRPNLVNVTTVNVTVTEVAVHRTSAETLDCQLSLCGCKCYPAGQTPEELNGTLCGINCRAEFNVSGCKAVNNACIEVSTNETENVSDAGWITVTNTSSTYNLLELAGGVEKLLTSSNLPIGTYNIVRLYVSNVSVVYNGVAQEAKLPSNKIDINAHFVVTENSSSLVTFDFNLNDSLHITGNGQIIMAPVINLEINKDVQVQVQGDGQLQRIRATAEEQTSVGMDENGTVGEGRGIPANLNLTIGNDGKVTVVRGGEQGQHEAQQYDVSVRTSGFVPATVTIKVGDTVRWVFRDTFAHRLVSQSAGFDSMARYQDQTWSYTFNTPGTYTYMDTLSSSYGQSQGTIIVEQ